MAIDPLASSTASSESFATYARSPDQPIGKKHITPKSRLMQVPLNENESLLLSAGLASE